MSKLITYDMLADFGNNIMVGFRFLHPNGLTIEELAKKAEEHTIYRIVYEHVKEGQNGNEHSVEC